MILIKTLEQIDGIRKSCQLATDTLDFLSSEVKAGVSTEHINQLAETFIQDHKAIPAPLGYHGFPKSICTSINNVVCHGIPSEQEILKDGDIVNVDVTTILDGYFGDTSMMYGIGEVSDVATRLMATTKDCLDLAIGQVKPENTFGMLGQVISKYAHSRGFSVVYQFCGHGVGIKFHEEPQIRHDDHTDLRVMKPGMIFTIEPMINQFKADAYIDAEDGWTARTCDGGLSAQYEHTVLVTDSGVEVLTK